MNKYNLAEANKNIIISHIKDLVPTDRIYTCKQRFKNVKRRQLITLCRWGGVFESYSPSLKLLFDGWDERGEKNEQNTQYDVSQVKQTKD